MIKKYLAAIAVLGSATVGIAEAASPTTPAASSTSTVSTPVRSSFIQGWSAGLNLGYQFNRNSGKYQRANFDSPALGVHLDYNHLVSSLVFVGGGLDANYCLTSKKRDGITLRKDISAALTGRLGTLSGPVAFNINAAVLVSGIKAKGGDGESANQTRVGVAPGIGMNFCVARNISSSINYRYEIYPKRGKEQPRVNSHNIFAKISYHFSK